MNNFLDTDGRIKKVYVQSDAPFRMTPEDMNIWYVRNSAGGMVPFSAFSTGHWIYGSPKLERYNGVSAMEIQGGTGKKIMNDAMPFASLRSFLAKRAWEARSSRS